MIASLPVDASLIATLAPDRCQLTASASADTRPGRWQDHWAGPSATFHSWLLFLSRAYRPDIFFVKFVFHDRFMRRGAKAMRFIAFGERNPGTTRRLVLLLQPVQESLAQCSAVTQE